MTKTEIFTKAKASLDKFNVEQRLDDCNAKMLFNCDYVALQSYNTIVAVFVRNKNIIVIDGHYSTTTDKHIAKFINRYPNVTKIWVYLRSDRKAVENNNKTLERYNKKTYADAFISDFKSIINKYI